jgi:hypothetical protein
MFTDHTLLAQLSRDRATDAQTRAAIAREWPSRRRRRSARAARRAGTQPGHQPSAPAARPATDVPREPDATRELTRLAA